MELRDRGRRVGRKRVARLMRAAGLRARPGAFAVPPIPDTQWQ
jgi:hypothetical protein